MGTNYYLRAGACPHCQRSLGDLHIGKSSAGWNFALRVYPRPDHFTVFGVEVTTRAGDDRLAAFGVEAIETLDDWRPLLDRFPIVDEYDRPVTAAELLAVITDRAHPNGLKSHVGLTDCAPGAGTYDLCPYEFS